MVWEKLGLPLIKREVAKLATETGRVATRSTEQVGLKFASRPTTDVVELTGINAAKEPLTDMCNLHYNRTIGSNSASLRRTLDELLNGTPETIRQEFGPENIENIYLINKIDSQFRNVRPTEYSTIGYRGECTPTFGRKIFERHFEEIKNAKVGDVIVPDVGYTFYGDSEKCLELFGKAHRNGDVVITYTTHIPPGAIVSRGISTNSEYGIEYLTPRGARHKVLAIEKISDNAYHIETDLLIDDLPPKLEVPAHLKDAEQRLLQEGELDSY